jgi:TRAP-type C4-dicarboxylate transport system permease large subunit
MFYYGLYQTIYNARQTSPTIGLVMTIPYASLAVCGVTGMTPDRLSKAIWPPFFVARVVPAIVTYLPWLSTYLPRLALGR